MTPDQHLHLMVGALAVENAFLRARIEELEKALEAAKESREAPPDA